MSDSHPPGTSSVFPQETIKPVEDDSDGVSFAREKRRAALPQDNRSSSVELNRKATISGDDYSSAARTKGQQKLSKKDCLSNEMVKGEPTLKEGDPISVAGLKGLKLSDSDCTSTAGVKRQSSSEEDSATITKTKTPDLVLKDCQDDSSRSKNKNLSSTSSAKDHFVIGSDKFSPSSKLSLLGGTVISPDKIHSTQKYTQQEFQRDGRRLLRYVNQTTVYKTVPNILGHFLELVSKKNDSNETYYNYLFSDTKLGNLFEREWLYHHSKYLHESNAMNIPLKTLAKVIPAACQWFHEEQWKKENARTLSRCLKQLLSRVTALKSSQNIQQAISQNLSQQGEVRRLLIDVLDSIKTLCSEEDYSKNKKLISEYYHKIEKKFCDVNPIMKKIEAHNKQTWKQDYLQENYSDNLAKRNYTEPFYKLLLTKLVAGPKTPPCPVACTQIFQTWQSPGNRKKTIVIEGTAGSGKSTILLNIFHEFTNQATSSVDTFAGIEKFDQALYIDCRKDSCDNFTSYLKTYLHLSLTTQAAIETIVDAFSEMKLLFLVDSLESCNDASLKLVKDLFHLFRRNKRVLFLVASRPFGWPTFLRKIEADMILDYDTFVINKLSLSEQESYLRLHNEGTQSNLSAADTNAMERFLEVRKSCKKYSPYVLPCYISLFRHLLRYCPEKSHKWTTEFSLLSHALDICRTQLKNGESILQIEKYILKSHQKQLIHMSMGDQKASTVESICVKKNSLWKRIFDGGTRQARQRVSGSPIQTDVKASPDGRNSFVDDVDARNQNLFLEFLVAEALVKRLQDDPKTPILELLPQHSSTECEKNSKGNKPRFSFRYITILRLTIMGLLKSQTRLTCKCLKNVFKILKNEDMDFEFWAQIVGVSQVTLFDINKVHLFVVQKAVEALANQQTGNKSWVVREIWQLQVTSQMLEQLVREAQPTGLLIDISEPTPPGSQLDELLQRLKRYYYGNFWLRLHHSYKNYQPCDDQVHQALQVAQSRENEKKQCEWRYKLWEFRGCISKKKAAQALVSAVHQKAKRGPQLIISLSCPLEHKLGVLQEKPHSLCVNVRYQAFQSAVHKSKIDLSRLQNSRPRRENSLSSLDLSEIDIKGITEVKYPQTAVLSYNKTTPKKIASCGKGNDEISYNKTENPIFGKRLLKLIHEEKFSTSRRCSLPTKNRLPELNVEKFGTFKRCPLPSGTRPPDLTVEDIPRDGGVAARALIMALAPNDKRFRHLCLERCRLNNASLKKLWEDLFDKDGLRTTEGGRPPMTQQSKKGSPDSRNVMLHLRENSMVQKEGITIPLKKNESASNSPRSSDCSCDSSSSSE